SPPHAGEELVAEAPKDTVPEQTASLTFWRWVGIRKAKPAPRPARTQDRRPQKSGKPAHAPKPVPAASKPKNEAPSALALQLAALKEKMGG
ncbi:MAG: hypothetical protein WA793_06285, partial [Sphingorhabdus sp.]